MNPLHLLANVAGLALLLILPAPKAKWDGRKPSWDLRQVHLDLLRVLRDEGPMSYDGLLGAVDYDEDDPDALPLDYHVGLLYRNSGYAVAKTHRWTGAVYRISITEEGLKALEDNGL